MMSAPAHLRRLARHFNEPQWLVEQREQAWAQFAAMPLPRLEKTDVSRRSWDIGDLATARTADESSTVATLLAECPDIPVVHVRDGFVEAVVLPAALRAQGVIFTSLHEAAVEHEALVRKHLGSVVAADDTRWHALNAALWSGGAFLYVPRNVTIETPFLFVYSHTQVASGSYPRILVVGEEHSRFTVTEVVLEANEATASTAHSLVAEVIAGAGCHVTYTFVSNLRKGSTHFVTRRSIVQQDGDVHVIGADIGDGFTVGLLETHLRGAGSHANTRVVGLGYGRQRLDLTVNMVHSGRHSESEIQMYGVLRDRANSLYRSCTHIMKGAAAAGSEQSDRMLMLDTSARADAIPMLLIDENDVQRCGHAASVGKLDPNHIYYLMSRGIPEREARRMIVWGYLQPALEAMPIEAVRVLAAGLINEVLL